MTRLTAGVVGLLLMATAPSAQQGGQGPEAGSPRRNPGPAGAMGVDAAVLPDQPQVFDTAEQHKIKVSVVAKGFAHPWALALLPDGSILVTERDGGLKLVSRAHPAPKPVAGVPEVQTVSLWGLMDVVLHPKFAENRLVYLSYHKPLGNRRATMAVARGRFDGTALADVTDIFVAKNPTTVASSRLAFGLDGSLFVTTTADDSRAQDPGEYGGKILRLRDDGSVPPDNPFTKRKGYLPEIYSLGHRSQVGVAVHPETGALWSTEHGRQGGDEVNVILPGRNYGWPVVSYGRDYSGARTSPTVWQDGFEPPLVVWVPSIAVTGIAFYTADRFPGWKGNVFVGGLQRGRISRTGRLERIVFNSRGEEIRRESLLTELKKRVRDVRPGAGRIALRARRRRCGRRDRRRNRAPENRADILGRPFAKSRTRIAG
jgi:glucose/arabinose dehydrogenase